MTAAHAYYDNLSYFDSLLKEGKAIYVVNNTEPKGLLSTTVNDPISGKTLKLEFPRTWIPFCLTSMLPKNVLEHNIDLRKTLQKNILKIIPEEQAVAVLNSERGREEYSRLMESEFTSGSRLNSDRKQQLVMAVSSAQQDVLSNSSVNQEMLELHPKMKAWEQRLVVGELNAKSLINELEIHRGELGKEDLQFLLTGQFPVEVKEFASEVLKTGVFKTKTPNVIPQEKYASEWDFEVQV